MDQEPAERATAVKDSHEAFVVLDSVLIQESDELITERKSSVMFFLSPDVISNIVHVRLADGKSSVTALPEEVLCLGEYVMHPAGGVGFQFC